MSGPDDGADPPEPGKTLAETARGPLAWFARNSVAANILMLFFLIGGVLMTCSIKQEVFPEFEMDTILVNVAYPGASPEEIEQGVVLAVEEAVRSIDGIKEVRSTASESVGVVVIDLLLGEDADQRLNDVKAAIDRITSFPENVERPVVFRARNRFQAISLVLYGEQSEKALRALAEEVRDELLQDPGITAVELTGTRPFEISIEVPQDSLRRYGLTLDQVAAAVSQASIDLPGGVVKTDRGEILLRTAERRERGVEFEEIVVLSQPDGTQVRLGDIGRVVDGFADTDQSTTYDGLPAVMVNVFRVGDQKPLDIADTVNGYVKARQPWKTWIAWYLPFADAVNDRFADLGLEVAGIDLGALMRGEIEGLVDSMHGTLPPGVHMATWFDTSEFYKDRINLLLKNAGLGLILVIIILGVFLEIRLAFWVTLGIVISFVGAMVFLPSTDVSINMISLFAFILVLGMVVDDAIIVGEAIYKRRQDGLDRLSAAIYGAKEMAAPVIFAILTSILAYMPMLFIPGPAGKFFRVIPIVVIIVLIMSLVEALLILPAHLAHSKPPRETGVFGWIHARQQGFSRLLERLIARFYIPVVEATIRRRYLAFAIAVAIFIGSIGLVAGGRVAFTFMPRVDGDVIVARAELPVGSSVERTRAVQTQLLTAAQDILTEHGGADRISRGVFSQVGSGSGVFGDPNAAQGSGGSHVTEVALYLVPTDKRPITSSGFAREWRQRLADVPGVEKLTFNFSTGPTAGAALHVQLSHPDTNTLERAAAALAERLEGFDGVFDIDSGFTAGKEQLDLRLTPEGRSLGLSEIGLARQVRGAFFGAEASRQLRGRDEVRVYARLPKEERRSEHNIEEMVLRTPGGGEVPLTRAAQIERGRSYTSIRRIDGRRAVAVTADVDPALGNAAEIMGALQRDVLPELLEQVRGLTYVVGGEQRDMKETMDSLMRGLGMAVLAMFALMAIPFRSYVQPAIVLLAIPFGFVGAMFGHVLMGFDLSLMSMLGVVALAGVVVNDSLVLMVAVNRYREGGMNLHDAVVAGGARRFRPILLTSVTTFLGLTPMLLETSVQARFLVPMAVSLAFGVLFATFITLLLVPAAYYIVEDAKWLVAKIGRALRGPVTPAGPPR